MADETKVVEVKEEKKEEKKFDIITMFDSIEKVLGAQHGRVVKEFNHHCEKSMRVVPIVTAIMMIENYKLLTEIRDLLKSNSVAAEEEKKIVRKPIK